MADDTQRQNSKTEIKNEMTKMEQQQYVEMKWQRNRKTLLMRAHTKTEAMSFARRM